jgi:hypothetical protein
MKKNILVLVIAMVFAFTAGFIGCKKEEAAAPEATKMEEKKEEAAKPMEKMEEAKKMVEKAMPKK